MSYWKLVSIAVIALALFACADDPLQRRKSKCDTYVKEKLLSQTEGKNCYTDKDVFKIGAINRTRYALKIWYPKILKGAKLLNAHVRTYPRFKHRPFPSDLDTPALFLDNINNKNLTDRKRYFVILHTASISPPEEGEDKDWYVSGVRRSDEIIGFPIKGIGVFALPGLDFSCMIFNYSKISNAKGCRAKVYVELLEGDIMLSAMAIDFSAPPKEEAFQTFFDSEMSSWDPVKTRNKKP